jgi:hypothetical protein
MNTQLTLQQNLDNFDDFYDMLTDSHNGLDEGQSNIMEAQLVLLLANHIGDLTILRQAFARARVVAELHGGQRQPF